MENSLTVIVKGLADTPANKIGLAVAEVIKTISKNDKGLDLRRLKKIILCLDLPEELRELENRTASGREIEYTDEKYAQVVGKVLTFPFEEDFEIYIILNVNVMSNLYFDNKESKPSPNFYNALHQLHVGPKKSA
jgi:hypothetical protein